MENSISAVDSTNRRQSHRFGFQNKFILETEKFQIIPNTYSKNISRKGALLVSESALPVGSILCIEIPAAKLQLIAEVRWVQSEPNGSYSVGIEFHELFPQTRQKLADFLNRLNIDTLDPSENSSVSLDLELSISSFLDHYVDELHFSDSIDAISSMRRLIHSTEKSYSFFTPSKSRTLDFTSTSFRSDEKTTEVHSISSVSKFLTVAISMLVVFGILAYQTHLIQKLNPYLPSVFENSVEHAASSSAITASETDLAEGILEKISWKGTDRHLEISFQFRDPVFQNQIEFSKINADQTRELIKISNVENKLDRKTIQLLHPMASQIRLGIHENQSVADLHIVIDIANANVAVTNQLQDHRNLIVYLDQTN